MTQLTYLKESPSQTAGPYVHIGCLPNFIGIKGVYDKDLGQLMVRDGVKGTPVTIEGHVYDGTGTPLKDVMIEFWQADAAGLYNSPQEKRGKADPAFHGWARRAADGTSGLYQLSTIKPGRVPWPDGRLQAPHISLWIVARGINLGLQTRLYFADEETANAEDPLLKRLEHQSRVPTLLARKKGNSYLFDIYLQGADETVFFDC